jgi:hypothetical protein
VVDLDIANEAMRAVCVMFDLGLGKMQLALSKRILLFFSIRFQLYMVMKEKREERNISARRHRHHYELSANILQLKGLSGFVSLRLYTFYTQFRFYLSFFFVLKKKLTYLLLQVSLVSLSWSSTQLEVVEVVVVLLFFSLSLSLYLIAKQFP